MLRSAGGLPTSCEVAVHRGNDGCGSGSDDGRGEAQQDTRVGILLYQDKVYDLWLYLFDNKKEEPPPPPTPQIAGK